MVNKNRLCYIVTYIFVILRFFEKSKSEMRRFLLTDGFLLSMEILTKFIRNDVNFLIIAN